MANKSLASAKKAKDDEFYTLLSDIENELMHYKEHFRGKTVLCNCDDPRVSNFFFYFKNNFKHLGLKRVITTCYKNQDADLFSEYKSEKAVYLVYDGDRDNIQIKPLKGDGDFRSQECVELLLQADIVVTNPPFSLFREYMSQLLEYDKKFLILGNQNNSTYKEIFTLLRDGIVWWGYNYGDMTFHVPSYAKPRKCRFGIDENGQKWRSFGNMCWYTNLEIKKRHEDMILYKNYSPEKYPQYDKYNAIFVGFVDDIPQDYDGAMGVPITFLGKYNPEQFEILSSNDFRKDDTVPFKEHGLVKDKDGTINGKAKYVRMLIRKIRKDIR